MSTFVFQIIFTFANGIGIKLAHKLETLGIVVEGKRINIDEAIEYDIPQAHELSTKNTSNILKVNLDVSAMLAYVSSVTNGSCDKYEFSVPVLAQQAEWECKRPVKPILELFFEGTVFILLSIQTYRQHKKNL